MTVKRPRAWIGEGNVPLFRGDITLAEAQELYEILKQAFNAGLYSGYRQGVERERV